MSEGQRIKHLENENAKLKKALSSQKLIEEENAKLKEEVLDYKKLEEDLLAERVFKKAKDRLVSWYTVGGIAIFVVGMVGIKTTVDYMEREAAKKLDSYSEKKIEQIIKTESHEQVELLLKKQQDTLSNLMQQLYINTKYKLDVTEAGYGLATSRDTTQSNPTAGQIDLSPMMNPVRDQGLEGSSPCLAAAAAVEYLLKKNGTANIIVSPRYIYNSINKKQDFGARFNDIFSFLIQTGAVEESYWPYKSGDFASPPPPSIANAPHYKIAGYTPVKIGSDLFRNVLSNKKCIIVGLAIYKSLYETNTGKYPTPKDSETPQGFHGVCLVGYDDSTQLFKFRNSWGADWGDHGYGYIKYSDINRLISEAYTIK